jgi:hypothetical protein
MTARTVTRFDGGNDIWNVAIAFPCLGLIRVDSADQVLIELRRGPA